MSSQSNLSLRAMTTSEGAVESFLGSIGLSEYFEIFSAEGFDTIESVEEINEDDLEHMQVKRGHRRVLQRALLKNRLSTGMAEITSPPDSASVLVRLPDSLASPSANVLFTDAGDRCSQHRCESELQSVESSVSPASSPASPVPSPVPLISCPKIDMPQPRQKRKYWRRPKPDLNAPEKPLSAYVMFSNRVREQLKGQQISFTEIARLVGERWKTLDQGSKESFERKAQQEKERWNSLMADYKLTKEYDEYRKYLNHFKEAQARRAALTAGNVIPNCTNDKVQAAVGLVNASIEDEESEEDGEDSGSQSAVLSPVSPRGSGSQLGALSHALPEGRPLKLLCTNLATRCNSPRLTSCIASQASYNGSPTYRSLSPPYHLPPPMPSPSQQRPTLTSLAALDQHLSISHSFFSTSSSNRYGNQSCDPLLPQP